MASGDLDSRLLGLRAQDFASNCFVSRVLSAGHAET